MTICRSNRHFLLGLRDFVLRMPCHPAFSQVDLFFFFSRECLHQLLGITCRGTLLPKQEEQRKKEGMQYKGTYGPNIIHAYFRDDYRKHTNTYGPYVCIASQDIDEPCPGPLACTTNDTIAKTTKVCDNCMTAYVSVYAHKIWKHIL